jgi:hypothetical protein
LFAGAAVEQVAAVSAEYERADCCHSELREHFGAKVVETEISDSHAVRKSHQGLPHGRARDTLVIS